MTTLWPGVATSRPLTPKMTAFLEAFADCGSIAEACRRADWRETAHYQALGRLSTNGNRARPGYPEAFEAAKAEFTDLQEQRKAEKERADAIYADLLENEVRRRALLGTIKRKRDKIGRYHETVYDNRLSLRVLAKFKPEYGDQSKVEHSGEITIKVKEEPNWYGNLDHSPAAALASGAGAAGSGPLQGAGLRPAVGQNGNGALSNGKGTRPY